MEKKKCAVCCKISWLLCGTGDVREQEQMVNGEERVAGGAATVNVGCLRERAGNTVTATTTTTTTTTTITTACSKSFWII